MTAPAFVLAPLQPAPRTILEALEDAAAAAAAEPSAAAATLRQVELLFKLGRDAEILAALTGRPLSPDFADRLQLMLARTLLERGGAEDLRQADALLMRLAVRARDARFRAAVGADLAKSLLAAGRPGDARRAAAAALADDPDSALGWMRFARASLACADAEGLLASAEARIERGPSGSGVLAAFDLALAVLDGRPVSALPGLERGRLAPPPGWASLDAFNAALAAELLAHPALVAPRTAAAGGHRLRVNEPLLLRGSPAFAALAAALVEVIGRRAAAAQGPDPWSAARPPRTELRIWSIVTHGPGHDRWHVHAEGWLSGVYYVQAPDHPGGEIELGCPQTPGAWPPPRGETVRLRPRAGDWITFPSHLHHRTWPTGSPERRISVAFDVVRAGAEAGA